MKNKKIKNYSGQLGIVLLLDDNTNKRAVKIAQKNLPEEPGILSEEDKVHVTLFHSKLKKIPVLFVKEIIQEISKKLPLSIDFIRTSVFAEKFFFWDIKKTRKLNGLHEISLSLEAFFEHIGQQQAEKENLSLSVEETENVKKYGHPLVKNLWRPHITLAYCTNSLSFKDREEKFKSKVVGVAFVRIGENGIVSETLEKIFL